jgi:hypothetical protein
MTGEAMQLSVHTIEQFSFRGAIALSVTPQQLRKIAGTRIHALLHWLPTLHATHLNRGVTGRQQSQAPNCKAQFCGNRATSLRSSVFQGGGATDIIHILLNAPVAFLAIFARGYMIVRTRSEGRWTDRRRTRDAVAHHCNEYHTKRVFRVVPPDHTRGL